MSSDSPATPLLDTIHSPDDVRALAEDQLFQLADECRAELIHIISQIGGHFAASLGVVELTIALHYMFDTPRDQLVWDVGHQGYIHKMLTGRRDRLYTIRKDGGLSPFLKRTESEYDAFGAGHASTSVSSALGMAEAFHQLGLPHKAVAILGDGGLTGGMALEGLNHAGHIKRNFVVVLNDNEMSIAPNVGALASFFSRKMTGKAPTWVMKETKEFLDSIPGIGDDLVEISRRAKDALKNFVSPGYMFEGLGFEYVGPVDGHRIDHLLEALRNIKDKDEPVLLHAITEKGRGYAPAEADPVTWHGPGPFDPVKGVIHPKKKGPPSYTKVFADALIEVAQNNPGVVAVTAAMPDGTGLIKFADVFPERCFDVGIAEQHAVTFCAGMAAQGLKPVAAIYSTFLQRAYDQIIHDVCIQNLDVTFCMDRAGLVGADGPTHHGAFDYSYLRLIPNMVVMAPRDGGELRHMVYTAIEHEGPVAVRYPRGNCPAELAKDPLQQLPIGAGVIEAEYGKDVALVAVGAMVLPALEAADALRAKGIHATVVNARFVKPLDRDLLVDITRDVGALVTIEENVLMGGFGSAVLELLDDEGISLPTHRLGIPDRFITHGSPDTLRDSVGLNAAGMTDAVVRFMADHVVPLAAG